LESAPEGRTGELAPYKDILEGISMVNAQLKDTKCLLSNLRWEMVALATSPSQGFLELDLAQLKSTVTYSRQSMDEVRRRMETLLVASTERLPGPDERGPPRY
jgi:hypothetical protein